MNEQSVQSTTVCSSDDSHDNNGDRGEDGMVNANGLNDPLLPEPYSTSERDPARARNHLANERTYLAWIRTGLALLGASIGLLKWQDISSVTAYMVALLGLMVMALSTRRYFIVMDALETNSFEPNVGEALFIVGAATVCIVATFVLHETEPGRHHHHRHHGS